MKILTVDCGLRWCGTALSDRGVLVDARLLENPEREDRGALTWLNMAKAVRATYRSVDMLCLEIMHHRQANSRGDGADLLEVNGVAGALVGLFADAKLSFYYPHEWTQLKKEVMWKSRVEPRLTAKEKAAIKLPAKSKAHNVKDAIGILLKRLGRLEPKRIIYR